MNRHKEISTQILCWGGYVELFPHISSEASPQTDQLDHVILSERSEQSLPWA